MKKQSKAEWKGWNFWKSWQKAMKQPEKHKICLLTRMLPKMDEKRNTNMPNGLIDSKSNVHEIQIQSIQIRNTRQTDKYNTKVDITAKHCVFVYLCIKRHVNVAWFKCQRWTESGWQQSQREGKPSEVPPARPSPSSPVYWFWGDATLKPSAGGRWERSIEAGGWLYKLTERGDFGI